MNKLNFHIGLHYHQPVGNFDGVFREAFDKSYKPFIDTISKHPAIKFALHVSGPIWDWIIKKEPSFMEDIEKLISAEQVELMSGGYYEPILSVLTDDDANGQIEMMNGFIRTTFKQNPTGIWLAERVWDPSLPKLIANTGLIYTILDDTHFYYAGIGEKDIHGYYITERSGHAVDIFPIQKDLRYAIPFKQPGEVIDILKGYMDKGIDSVTYADDGEKFGLWPGTFKWVYGEKWLDKFFIKLEENSGWLNITTFGSYISSKPPAGRVYIPSSSYEELLEWALPVDTSAQFRALKSFLQNSPFKDTYKPFIRGSFWDNFLAKYPESNWMHKRMLYMSKSLSDLESKKRIALYDARRELYKSQSNCVYWHGLFGGIYLNYLRHAVFKHLLRVESMLDAHRQLPEAAAFLEYDIDLDGKKEIVLKNKHISLYINPSKGGSAAEIDLREYNFNITNIMTRRKEAYHDIIPDGHYDSSDSPVSIHNLINSKEGGLRAHLFYDWHPRYSFVEHFLQQDVLDVQRLYMNRYTDLGDFTLEPYRFIKYEDNTVFLSKEGHININSELLSFRLEKSYSLFDRRLETGYRLTNNSDKPIDVFFIVELNLSLLGTDALRSIVIKSGAKEDTNKINEFAVADDINEFDLIDRWQGFEVSIIPSLPARFYMYPIETVSSSESGFEKIYQGTCFMLVFKLKLESGMSSGITVPINLHSISPQTEGHDV